MKRSCLIIALLFAIVSVGWANMLTNPGFETSAGWSRSGNVDYYSWGARTASSGLVFQSWIASPAGFSQEVAAASGTYTFSIWGCAEANYAQLTTELKIEWLNASGTPIQATTNNITLVKDASWHNLFVSGTCTSSEVARVRVSVRASWSIGSGGGISFLLDDADLYAGPYAGTQLSNGSFEYYGAWRGGQWNGSRDLWGYGDGGTLGQDWANRSGTSGVAFYSYANDGKSNYTVRFWQNVNPTNPAGVYTYALWINRETSALFSNAVMKIEWYDSTFTNKVQDDSVSNLTTIPNDYNWYEYHIEANSTSPAMREARIVFSADWTYTTTEPGRATKLDDVRFVSMSYSDMTNAFLTDWCYHNAVGYHARGEAVPGTNVGSFLQLDYNTTTVTFYVLADISQARYYPLEDNRWEVRTSYENPTNLGNWVTAWNAMTRIGDVVIPSGTAFHGQPLAGSKTASVWKLVWPMPKNAATGLLFTNRMLVYYAPYTKTTNTSGTKSDERYLLGWSATTTNNLGQQLGTDPFNRDYAFDINPIKWAAFTNGGFENPVPFAANLDNTGWWGLGGAYRETWAARSGGAGAVFPSWDAGAFSLYQDISTTGGTYQFSGYMQCQTGAVPSAVEMRMEWYDKAGTLVQENKKNVFSDLYEEDDWSHFGVVGSCTVTNLDYVRVILSGWYNEGVEHSATMIDDMDLTGVATNLQNTGFETGIWRDIRDWYGAPQWRVMTEAWANFAGSNGLAFHGWWTNEPRYEAKLVQPVVASTGTYIYSAWIKRESGFINLTNMEVRLEWYGGNYPTKLQADSVIKITPPSDGSWNQYTVTGTCNNTSVRFVQPVVFAQWDANPDAAGRTIQIDENSLVYTNLGGETYTDGIPDSWWSQYSISGGDRTALGDFDSDGYLNIEEYAGDTVPTNNASYFPRVTNTLSGDRSVMILVVNPSSAARAYDAWWKTNLVDPSAWQPYGLTVPGNGGLITLTVTNGPVYRYYRTGAKLP